MASKWCSGQSVELWILRTLGSNPALTNENHFFVRAELLIPHLGHDCCLQVRREVCDELGKFRLFETRRWEIIFPYLGEICRFSNVKNNASRAMQMAVKAARYN